jgi:hypothetical protein
MRAPSPTGSHRNTTWHLIGILLPALAAHARRPGS